MELWNGCFIAESLEDPRILNDYEIYKVRITDENLPLDELGTLGRWHMYWVKSPIKCIGIFEKNMKYNWYGHFWKDNKIVAIFQGKSFTIDADDRGTWSEAIAYGKAQGILEEQLDFRID